MLMDQHGSRLGLSEFADRIAHPPISTRFPSGQSPAVHLRPTIECTGLSLRQLPDVIRQFVAKQEPILPFR